MATIDTGSSRAINACVWRDLAQLAAEALAIGVVFSLLLALAVFVVARGGHGEEFAGLGTTPIGIHAAAATG